MGVLDRYVFRTNCKWNVIISVYDLKVAFRVQCSMSSTRYRYALRVEGGVIDTDSFTDLLVSCVLFALGKRILNCKTGIKLS